MNLFRTSMFVPQQAPVGGDRSTWLPLVSPRPFDHPAFFDLDLDWEEPIGSTVIGPKSPFGIPGLPGLPLWLTNAWVVQGWTTLTVDITISWPTIFLEPAPGITFDPVLTMSNPISTTATVEWPHPFPMESIDAMVRPIGKTRSYGYRDGYRAKGEPSQLDWRMPQNYDHINREWDTFNPLEVPTLDNGFAIKRVTDVTQVYSFEAGTNVNLDFVMYAACQGNASVLRARTEPGGVWHYLHTFRVTIACELVAPVGGGGPFEHESGAATTLPRAAFTNVVDPPAAGFRAPEAANVGTLGAVGQITLEGLPGGGDLNLPLYCIDAFGAFSGEPPWPAIVCNAGMSGIRKRSTNALFP